MTRTAAQSVVAGQLPATGPDGGRVRYRLACVRCGAEQPAAGYLTACHPCGGLLDAVYDLSQAVIGPPGTDPLSRFADLLPTAPPAAHGIAGTPLLELDAGPAIPVPVYAKWEGAHPTGSAKDPMAVVSLAYMHGCGVRAFAFSSTGNTTAAFAWALPMWPDLTGHVFVPAGFPGPASPPPNLVVHEVPGDYAAAHQAAHHATAAAGRDAMAAEGGFLSVGRREGLKLAYLEALTATPRPPTVVVQAVSSGMGIVAAAKAATELTAMGLLARRPRLVAVQQESCAPMVASFLAGAATLRPADVISNPDGPAVAMLLGDPSSSYPYVRDTVLAAGGTLVAARAADISAALADARRCGLDVCFSSATALAGVAGLYRAGGITEEDVVLVNLTGSARSAAGRQEMARLARRP